MAISLSVALCCNGLVTELQAVVPNVKADGNLEELRSLVGAGFERVVSWQSNLYNWQLYNTFASSFSKTAFPTRPTPFLNLNEHIQLSSLAYLKKEQKRHF